MKVILVHGFNVSDGGAGSVGTLKAFLRLRGIADGDVQEFDYGWTFLLGVRFGNPGRARKLYQAVRELGGAIGVGHSNGCTVLLEAAKRGAEFARLVFVNPAVGRKAKLPPQVQRCDVFYTVDDPWTWIARWLPLHPWGDMGNAGYRGEDPRWVSWNMSKGIRRQAHPQIMQISQMEFFSAAIHAPRGHSGVFQGGDAPQGKEVLAHYFWMPQIAAAVAGVLE